MSTAWTDIRTEVRSELEEDVAAVYTDALLLAWWNEGQSDYARRSRSLTDEQYATCSVGQQSYTLPDKTIEIVAANYNDKGLARTEYTDFSQLTASGIPTDYALWDEAIYLYPIPSVSGTGTLYVQRYYEPSPMVATSSTDFSVRDIMSVKSYVKMRAYEMSGDLQMAEWHRKQYEQAIYERRIEAQRLRESGHAHEPGVVW